MKHLLFLSLVFFLISCGGSASQDNQTVNTSSTSLVEKRIKQRAIVNGMGMLKNVEVVIVEKINDSTFTAAHTFFNPITELETRTTNKYFFTTDLDSIKSAESIKTEGKIEGEWTSF